MQRVRFDEGSHGTLEGDLVDDLGVPVPASQLVGATLTLYDWDTRVLDGSPQIGVINDRYQQDVLNTHEVAIDESGHFRWDLQAADNVIVTPIRQVERHRAVLSFEWQAGQFNMEVEIEVVNLGGVLS